MFSLLSIRKLLLILWCFYIASFSYAEKVLITCGTSFLGQSISEKLSSKGYDLILTGRNVNKLNALKKRLIVKYNNKVDVLIVNFSQVSSIEKATRTLMSKEIDSMVVITPRPDLSGKEIPSYQRWEKAISETFIAPLEFIRTTVNEVNTLKSVVIISGTSYKYFMPNFPNTNVIRFMWLGELKNLSYQFGEKGIRVNIVSPGLLLTEHNTNKIQLRADKSNKSFSEQLSEETAKIPSRRYGQCNDVANLVDFLIDHKSEHVNGTDIVIDGGDSKGY